MMAYHPTTTSQGFASTPLGVRFGGYYWNSGQLAPTPYLEGHTQAGSVAVEFKNDAQQALTNQTLINKGLYWEASQPLSDTVTLRPKASSTPQEVLYRFVVDGQQRLDATETRVVNGQQWNVARPNLAPTQSVGTLLYLYPDAAVTLDAKGNPTKPLSTSLTHSYVTHGGGAEGAFQRIDQFLIDPKTGKRTPALGGVMMSPLTGDWVSPHHYWTADPFASVWQDKDLKRLMQYSLQDGIKLYFDGAFVNHGMMSPQYQSLLLHGARSPYWNWYQFDRNTQGALLNKWFPSVFTDRKLVLGVLPIKPNGLDVNWDRVGVRLINSPNPPAGQPAYNPNRPTAIQLFDPIREAGKDTTPWLSASGSVYNYTFPIANAKDVSKKLQILQGKSPDSVEYKQAMVDWPGFRLGRPDEDDSGEGWDGKIPAKRLNLANPAVQGQAQQALTYWTQRTDSEWLFQPLTELLTQHYEGNWATTLEKLKATQQLAGRLANLSLPQTITPRQQRWESSLALGQRLSQLLPPVALNLHSDDPAHDLTFIKHTLGWPKFEDQILGHHGSLQPVYWASKPLRWLLNQSKATQPLAKKLDITLGQQSLNSQLGRALEGVFRQLSPESQLKLLEPSLRDAVLIQLAPVVWRQLLSGQTSDDINALGAGMDRQLGAAMRWDPATAASTFRKAMQRQVGSLNTTELARLAEKTLAHTTVEAATVARHLMTQGEVGLNWRLDAAVDIANTAAIRNASQGNVRDAIFVKEMRTVRDTWAKLLSGVRAVFPKTVIMAELDPEKLGASKNAVHQAYQLFFEPLKQWGQSVFTSMPNMSHWFSGIPALVNAPAKPWEHGDWMLGPQQFANDKLAGFLQMFPAWVSRMALSLLASHDYATVNHALVRNPNIASMASYGMRGLLDDTNNVLEALQTKADLAGARATLKSAGIADVGKALNDLNTYLHTQTPELTKELSALIRDYMEAPQKKFVGDAENLPKEAMNQRDMRVAIARAIPEMVRTLQHDGKVLPELLKPFATLPAQNALESILVHYLPLGEVWATRAALANAIEAYGNNNTGFKQAFYHALEQTEAELMAIEPTLLAHLSPNKVLDAIFNQPEMAKHAAHKAPLWEVLMKPVMAKQAQMVFAQLLSGGNAALYGHDFMALAGGESTDNRHQQNRDALVTPYNKAPAPWLLTAQSTLRTQSQWRRDHEKAFNGFWQPVSQDDTNGVFMSVWDGGPQSGNQQIIGLLPIAPATGELFNQDAAKANPLGKNATYPITRTPRKPFAYTPDISTLGMPDGTRYRQEGTQNTFVVSKGKLVALNGKPLMMDATKPDAGVLLVRETR
ncbi:MAG: hypothetical protein QE263_00825 [Vampirovibrionales bacterium]|nr:hypothetical protein [Vampirovibrionales bacterium]